MNKSNALVFAVIRDVTYILDYLGVPSVCIGGAARDLYYGKTPKDVDIMVLRNPPGMLSQHIDPYELADKLISRGAACEVFQSYDGSDCSDYLDWVIKLNVHGVDVDIIKHIGTPADEQDAMSRMECSLNAICVTPPVDGFLHEFSLHPLHPGLNDGKVTWLNHRGYEVDTHRRDYLKEKYPELEFPDNIDLLGELSS